MELIIKGNINYCASIVSIKNIIDLEGCNNIKGTTIFGNHVIVSKDVKIGELGVYFPVECRISDEFLSYNNLFDKPELNRDKTKKGFFSTKGRVRAVRLRGFKSDGFWIPVQSLSYLFNDYSDKSFFETNMGFKEGDSFDHINGNKVCEKYFVPCYNGAGSDTKRNEKKSKKRFSKVIDTQFRFHIDTQLLGRNLDKLKPYAIYDISQKMHGCVSDDTIIDTLEFGQRTIKEVVDGRISCHVKAFDVQNNKVVYVPIDEYYLKKDDGDWYEIELENGNLLKITGNNPMWLPELSCYREVNKLHVGDIVLID